MDTHHREENIELLEIPANNVTPSTDQFSIAASVTRADISPVSYRSIELIPLQPQIPLSRGNDGGSANYNQQQQTWNVDKLHIFLGLSLIITLTLLVIIGIAGILAFLLYHEFLAKLKRFEAISNSNSTHGDRSQALLH